jgi:Zn-dependent protease/CBS domain-containing protein
VRESIPLGRVAGIPVSLDWTVLVILSLFAWSLAITLPKTAPGYPTAHYWLAGITGSVVLLASLLAHELSHAVVARRAGVEVSGVTLWLFGGVARLGDDPKTAAAEFRIAIAGPAVSLGLAVAFGAAAAIAHMAGLPAIVCAVATWLATVNLLLGVFNLLPGAPLDGGRVLAAYLWRRSGDATRAAISAARAGRTLASIMIVLGFVQVMAGGTIAGVWLALIGLFVHGAAREEERRLRSRQLLTGVSVGDAMTAGPRTAPAAITAEDFIQHYLLGGAHSAYPVVAPDGSVLGMITLTQLRKVSPDRRATTPLRDIAIPLRELAIAAPDEPLTSLLARLSTAPGHRVLVIMGGRVVGIVTATDIAKLLEARDLVFSSRPGASWPRS